MYLIYIYMPVSGTAMYFHHMWILGFYDNAKVSH